MTTAQTQNASADAVLHDAQRGIAAAQRSIYNEHANMLMVVCSRYLPQREDAEEALMDTFIAAFKALPRFIPVGTDSLRPWLKKIAVNICLMRLRRDRSAPMLMDINDEAAVSSASDEADALSAMSAREILAAVQKLPAGYRAVFNLYVFEGLSHAEIAETLDISESTSKTQLLKARRAMQSQLRSTHAR